MYYYRDCSEALQDLIYNQTVKLGRKPSYKELSSKIKEKTGVEISTASLCDYVTGRKSKSMTVKNLLALSEYFDVSVDFILGISLNRKHENISIGKRTGLKDKAIKTLEAFFKSPQFDKENNLKTSAYTAILNELIPDNDFANLLIDIYNLKELRKQSYEEKSKIKYSPELKRYFYNKEIISDPEFTSFEKAKKNLYGENSEVIHKDQYCDVLNFNISQAILRIVDKITNPKETDF